MSPTKRALHPGSKGHFTSRHGAVGALVLASLLLIPVAISWACGPNRAIQLDKVSYCPRCDVNVTGANFESGATVEIKVDGRQVASTTVSATGNIATSFSAPPSPGTYAVRTDGVDQQGQALAGTGNTVMLTVEAEAPAPSPGGGSGSVTPGTPRTSPPPERGSAAPRTTSGEDGRRTGGNNRSASGGERLGRAPANGGSPARGEAPANPGAPADAGVNTTEGTITTGRGGTAFAGSVTQATRREAAERAAEGSSAGTTGQGPSERSAESDLWSGLSSGKNPSLVPSDGAGLTASGTSSELTWGLLLLIAGLLALIGLGVAEATRRRRASTS